MQDFLAGLGFVFKRLSISEEAGFEFFFQLFGVFVHIGFCMVFKGCWRTFETTPEKVERARFWCISAGLFMFKTVTPPDFFTASACVYNFNARFLQMSLQPLPRQYLLAVRAALRRRFTCFFVKLLVSTQVLLSTLKVVTLHRRVFTIIKMQLKRFPLGDGRTSYV
jgi:hypothetical protein